MVPPLIRMVSPHKSGRLRGSSGVVGPRAFFAFFMYFVWMSVTGILRVLGDGPEEGSEEVVFCERPPLRGRRESGVGWCTGISNSVTREWRHESTRATRVAPQEVMSSRWNDGTESAWHKGSTEFETRYHCRGKEGDREKQTNPPLCARTCQRRIKIRTIRMCPPQSARKQGYIGNKQRRSNQTAAVGV